MIKVTVREAYDMQLALKELLETPLPVKAAYRLGRLASKMVKPLQDFEALRYKLFQKYGTPVEGKSDTFEVKDQDKAAELSKEIEPLLGEEIIFDLEPLTPEDLGDVKVNGLTLIRLEKVIV